MDGRLAKTLVAFGFSAIFVSACQRDEPEVTVEPGFEAAETRTAWVDSARLANADAEPENWLAHGRTSDEQRFSPLDQINISNVGDLSLAWYTDLDTNRGQEATPIVVDGVMYSTSAWS